MKAVSKFCIKLDNFGKPMENEKERSKTQARSFANNLKKLDTFNE